MNNEKTPIRIYTRPVAKSSIGLASVSAKLSNPLPCIRVINAPVTALDFNTQIALILKWAKAKESKSVCVANVHMVVEAHRNPAFAKVMENADLVTPDGMPLVWMLRWLGNPNQNRVAGLDIMHALCDRAVKEGLRIFLLGSTYDVLERIKTRLKKEFPDLKIAGAKPLPFRPLTKAEEEELSQMVNSSGAKIVMVSLGCPKQEIWISKQRHKIQAVMVGLGGAFPVYAGLNKRAPKIIRAAGMEWLYRLIQEPKRLWWRYTSTIPTFLLLSFKQLVIAKIKGVSPLGKPRNVFNPKG